MSLTREEARAYTRAAVETFYAHFGQYVSTPGQETIVLHLGTQVGHRVSDETFEEALEVMQRRYEFDQDTTYALDGDRNRDREKLEEELADAINRIVGNGPKGEK